MNFIFKLKFDGRTIAVRKFQFSFEFDKKSFSLKFQNFEIWQLIPAVDCEFFLKFKSLSNIKICSLPKFYNF